MSGFSNTTNEHLIRSELWSRQIKEVFLEELQGTRYVDFLTDFPDGELINIPSFGQMEVRDYEEGQSVQYAAFSTGNYQFSISEYKSVATYITDKNKQDSFYSAQLVGAFVPKMTRAIAVAMETDVLAIGPSGQTSGDLNAINGVPHRWVGKGSSNVIAPSDFAKAKLALRMAQVPQTNLVAIVHPSTLFTLETMTNLVNLSNNPRWEGVVRDGAVAGMKFMFNVFGFDVYTSTFLPEGISETIDGTVVTDGAANIFFSAAGGDTLPFKGLIRQAPRVESSREKNLQRDEYVMTARYGFGFYRPENFVCVLTDPAAAIAAV